MNFRKDINGLRAIAVLAVVIYHFFPEALKGGFSGVDVFFVISGFLMSKIIFTGLEKKSFSLISFYTSRANRIIPPLAGVSIVLLILGWFYLGPVDYKELAKHVFSSIAFLSNLIYWKEAGYFDSASHSKWLLHTWSLSVEWQFYIIYPIILLLLNKFFPIHRIKYIVLASAFLGLVISVYCSVQWPTSSYYLLHTRAWEMLLGAVAFLFPFTLSAINKKILELTGITLIIVSYFFVSEADIWPGYLAAIPVLGTFFVIQAQQKDSLLTGNLLFQKLGTWSYSIYLWHWPLVVAGGYFSLDKGWLLAGIPFSILLGYLSYQLIEKRSASYPPVSFKKLLAFKPAWYVVFVVMGSSLIFISKGAYFHYSSDIKIASDEAHNKNPYECMTGWGVTADLKPCYIGNENNIAAIIVGDSHADALTTSISHGYDLKEQGIIALTRVSCPFIVGAKSTSKNTTCHDENEQRMMFITSRYSGVPVIIASRLSVYINGEPETENKINPPSIYFTRQYDEANLAFLSEFQQHVSNTVCQLVSSNPVILAHPVPEMGVNVPSIIVKHYLKNNGALLQIDSNRNKYLDMQGAAITIVDSVAKECGASTVSPADILCETGNCLSSIDGRPLYYDDNHLSEFGNKLLTPLFHNALTSVYRGGLPLASE
ncbi:MAG: acyltransferase family protein [Colwellia sp.]